MSDAAYTDSSKKQEVEQIDLLFHELQNRERCIFALK